MVPVVLSYDRANRASQTTGTNVGSNGPGGAQVGSNGNTSNKGKGKHPREEGIESVGDDNNDDIEEMDVAANTSATDKEAGPSTPTARKFRKTIVKQAI
ncbi:hypothetical protein A4X13_0g9096 [Tilletia indica]|uniref:Uncharacterized protein n=1 Tax=Tilletia indica TaxID=43049 RepID=A0A177SYX8_9BASI|nr:hypothetical protein A4X13_0g9096 [Tilletia indica]